MTEKENTVSIIIPAYNEEKRIGGCIRSILSSGYRNYEIIMADDCSTDNTFKIASSYPCKIVKTDKHGGPAYARNLAVNYAKGDILFFMDADIRIKENTLEEIVQTFKRRPDIAAVISVRTKESLNEDLSGPSKELTPTYWALWKYYTYMNSKVDYATFFSTNRGAIRRKVFDLVGKFDTKYKEADFEDYQIGYFLSDRGYKIFINKNIQISHRFPNFSSSLKKFLRKGGLYAQDILFKRKKADNVDITFGRLFRAGLAFLSFLSLFISIRYNNFFIFFVLSLLVLIVANLRFYAFVLKEKSFLHILAFIWIEYILAVAGAFGVLISLFRSSKLSLSNKLVHSGRFINMIYPFLNSNCPAYIIFFVTSKCQSKCKMCFNWRNISNSLDREELSLDEIQKISSKLNRIIKLTLSGGEPFLRDDLAQICEIFYKNNRVYSISIPTNCLLPEKINLLTEKILEKCKGISLKLQLSLDGLYAEHDEIRGIKGNFQKVLETYSALDALKKRFDNLELTVATTFSSFNQGDINDIIKFVKEGLPEAAHIIDLVRGDVYDGRAKDFSLRHYVDALVYLADVSSKDSRRLKFSSRLSEIARFRIREVIIETLEKKKMIVPCVAGSRMVIINDIGEVYPCELLKLKMGDLRDNDYDFKKILKNNKSKQIQRYIKDKQCWCTFECAIGCSLIFNKKEFLRLLFRTITNQHFSNICRD